MGVAGVGKSTIGKMLSKRLSWEFYDADDYHPKANIEKMRKGVQLTDGDRLPWLRAIRDLIDECLSENKPSIIACSALKRSYREFLKQDRFNVTFVYLRGDEKTIWERLSSREGHFAGTDLLESQLETLEEPHGVLEVDISKKPEEIADFIMEHLRLSSLER
ncbi:MAG: gluconokinase [Thermodesulfobacteriota bacterium]